MTEIEFPYQIVDKKREAGLKSKAQITNIQEVKAGQIFGEKARDPAQSVYAIYARIDGRDMRVATFSKPFGKEISSKTKLAQFKQRYKQFPKVGLKIDLMTSADGFWNIVL